MPHARASKKPEGQPTRGKTASNRLRRVDNFIQLYEPSLLTRTDGLFADSMFVDLGYGFDARTTLESAARFRRVNPHLKILGVEIEKDRVEAALPFADDRTFFRLGGFNLPLQQGETVRLIRALNFSFVGGAAAFRANAHIAVRALIDAVPPRVRRAMQWLIELAMIVACLFMIVYGIKLVQTTWHQGLAEFPDFPVGLNYSPIPLGGFLTLLFIIEKLWVGEPPKTSVMYRDEATAVE